jgi:hypothetical protein
MAPDLDTRYIATSHAADGVRDHDSVGVTVEFAGSNAL